MRIATRDLRFVVCLSAGADEDLTVGTVYLVLPDPVAERAGCWRVIDDSGEDYLYPAKRFVEVSIPETARRRLVRAVRAKSATA